MLKTKLVFKSLIVRPVGYVSDKTPAEQKADYDFTRSCLQQMCKDSKEKK